MNTGAGADTVLLYGDGYIHIGKALTVTSSGASGEEIQQRVEAKTDLQVGGAITLRSGAGKTVTQTVLGKTGGTGAVNLTGGTNVDLAFNGDIHGAVRVIAAATAMGGSVDIGSATTRLQIQGALTVDLNSAAGGMANLVNLNTVSISRGLVLLGGDGRDQFVFEDVIALGTVNIDGGASADDLVVESLNALPSSSQFLGAFTFKGGAGDDHIEWCSSTSPSYAITATKLVTFDGGTGTDTVNVGSASTFVVPLNTLSFP